MRIVDFILQYSDKGVPLTRAHVCEAASILIDTLPYERQIALPFVDGKPGRITRHSEKLKSAAPSIHEHKRFVAVNAETLTCHFSALEELFSKFKLNSTRTWNLDQGEITSERDREGSARTKRIVRRESSVDSCTPYFTYTNRITLMPVVNAAGEAGPCLFDFEGSQLPFRNIVVGDHIQTGTPTSDLPTQSVVRIEPGSPGVKNESFLSWAKCFTSYIAHLLRDGRKVLSIYDGYRSHLSLELIELGKNEFKIALSYDFGFQSIEQC